MIESINVLKQIGDNAGIYLNLKDEDGTEQFLHLTKEETLRLLRHICDALGLSIEFE